MYFIRRCIVFQKNLSCDNPLQESYLYCLYFQGFPQFWKRRFYSKHINIQKVTTSASKRSALIFSRKSIFVSKVFEFTSSLYNDATLRFTANLAMRPRTRGTLGR